MSRIVIDGRWLGGTGMGRYTTALLEQLQRLDNRNRYIVLMQRRDRGKFQPTAANFQVRFVNAPEYTLREQLWLPLVLYWLRADLVHFVAPNIPLLYWGRFIVTIHDLTLLRYRNVRRSRLRYAIKYWAFRPVITHAVRHAAGVITATKFGQKELVRQFNLSTPDRLSVIPMAVDSPMAGGGKPNIESPYLLYVGNYYPYKNVRRLIEAMPAIAATNPELKLVLVGNTSYFGAALRQRAEQLRLVRKIVFAGFVDDDELVGLYRHASLFIFPSLSEGFGLPGLEAMSYGLPVVAARSTALPEVYGHAAEYFDPTDPNDIARAVSETLASKATLARLRRAGRELTKKYSWKSTGEQTLAAYLRNLR